MSCITLLLEDFRFHFILPAQFNTHLFASDFLKFCQLYHLLLFLLFFSYLWVYKFYFIFISNISLGSGHKWVYPICLLWSSLYITAIQYWQTTFLIAFYIVPLWQRAIFLVSKSLSRHPTSGYSLPFLKEPTQVPFLVGSSLWYSRIRGNFTPLP